MADLFIGLMSGTSLDGVDGVLADLGGALPLVAARASAPFPEPLRAELLALNASGGDELHRAWLAGNGLMRVYAQVVATLLRQAGLQPAAVTAIGAHGQTVRHRPGGFDGTGYTIQLAQPALLAELAGIDVVADFRSRDVAAGGQGAPLAPFFHRAVFARPGQDVGILNLGGMSNLTVLRGDGSLLGFDCGPGNVLLDAWAQRHLGRPYDADGAWGAGGTVKPMLLGALLAEPFFDQAPPKSTGRDLFSPAWLGAQLATVPDMPPQDVQATLAALTAHSCANEVRRHAPGLVELVVCGGGALNGDLMRRLGALLPGTAVMPSTARGIAPLDVEALAFAWLARKAVRREPLDLTSTTGAKGARILGALWPA